jgi:hypothetical protein
VRGADALAFQVSASHGINQNQRSRKMTKSEFSGKWKDKMK